VMEQFRGQFTIVPVLVGSLSPDKEAMYGRLLAPYLADPANLFVISSDFCHWGQRFRYVNGAERAPGRIHEFIRDLDREAMDTIEALDPAKFTQYLQRTGNTICGRHPIGVLLHAIAKLAETPNGHRMKLKFLKYAQSSQCRSINDSSVSYAAAALTFE